MSELPNGNYGTSQVIGHNIVKAISVEVGTTAVNLSQALKDAGVTKWMWTIIQQLGGNDLFLGASDVTIVNGIKIADPDPVSLPISESAEVWAVSDMEAQDVRVMATF